MVVTASLVMDAVMQSVRKAAVRIQRREVLPLLFL